MPESWRPIVGFEGSYEVSDHGRVRSVDRYSHHPVVKKLRRSGKLMKQSTVMGYKTIALYRNGRHVSRKVHRLVLEAFKGTPEPGHDVARHLNGDRADNRLVNLAWGTASENNFDRVRHGTHQEARKTHCPQGHPYDAVNTYTRPDGGGRMCRRCGADREARRRSRLKSERASQP